MEPHQIHKFLKLLDNTILANAKDIYQNINNKKEFSDEDKKRVTKMFVQLKESLKDSTNHLNDEEIYR